ncbi:MAG: translation initiation factor IF-3, partial [Gemmatimonadota bacterium]
MAAPRKNRVNQDIKSESVRLIDAVGGQVGVVPLTEALESAQETGFDLVEISPNAEPPVCRLMDYGKFL